MGDQDIIPIELDDDVVEDPVQGAVHRVERGDQGPVDMIDLTEDDDDVEVISCVGAAKAEGSVREVNYSRKSSTQPQNSIAAGDVNGAFFGNSEEIEAVAAQKRIDQEKAEQEMRRKQLEAENDDLIVEGSVKKSEEEIKEISKNKVHDLLDWFIRLKPEHITSFKAPGDDYLTSFIADGPFLDVVKCKKIAEDFKNNQSIVGLASKWDLDNDELLIYAVCIGVLELLNSLDIDFDSLCTDRIDEWSMKKCQHFFELTKPGLESKNGPLKFMQFTVTTPASAFLLITISWLKQNDYICRFHPEDGLLDHQILDLDPFELSNDLIDTAMRHWESGIANGSISDQTSSALDELFNELKSTSEEVKEQFAAIRDPKNDFLNLVREPIPDFEDDDVKKLQFLSNESREELIKSRAELEALKEETSAAIAAATAVYSNKTDLEKQFILRNGDFCLAREFPTDNHDLTYAICQERVNPTSYKVKFVATDKVLTVHVRDLAMTHILINDPVFVTEGDVGLRVAVRIAHPLNQYNGKSMWVSGTIAGRRTSHRGDFLVFLDNGKDVYVKPPGKPEDPGFLTLSRCKAKASKSYQTTMNRMNAAGIAVMVAQPLTKDGRLNRMLASSWIRHPQRAQYVGTFMKEFPEYPLLRMTTGSMINLSFQDKMYTAMVMGVDRAFAIVRYRNLSRSIPGYDCVEYPCTKNHPHVEEKVYRGSNRFEGVMQKKNMLTNDNNLSRRRKGQIASQFEPTEAEITFPQARSMPPVMRRRVPEAVTAAIPIPNEETKKVIAEKKRKEKLFSKDIRFTPLLPPKSSLKQHDRCAEVCLQKMDSDPYDPRFHQNSPIHTPLLCGWRRTLYVMNSGKKRSSFRNVIMYFGPCGKPLKDMTAVSKYIEDTRSKLTIDCFSFESDLDTETYVTVSNEYLKINDLADTHEGIPIPVVNSVDNEELPAFSYSTRRFQYDHSVDISTISRDFCSGCSCTDNCSDPEKCECQQLTMESIRRLPKHARTPLDGPYVNRILKSKVMTGMYECNDQCQCKKDSCYNRVVQKPIKYPVQIYKTAQSGWGCRALTDIPVGAFICTYVGALLTNDLADCLNNDDQYFADLDLQDTVEQHKGAEDNDIDHGFAEGDEDYEQASDESEEASETEGADRPVRFRNERNQANVSRRETRQHRKNEEVEESPRVHQNNNAGNQVNDGSEIFKWDGYFANSLFVVDAKKRGNLGRFLNHSCDPNVKVQHVLFDTHDLRLPWVAFFSTRHIHAGDELAWDYQYTIQDTNSVRINCHCGAPCCRGQLL